MDTKFKNKCSINGRRKLGDAEVTIYANNSVIRAEESSENLYATIDLVADKIARQLRKYKKRHQDKKTNA